MKAVLRSLLCMLLILTAFVNTGCAKGADEDADYKVYYLNKENTKIVSSPYELQAKDTKEKGGSRKETEAVIEELLGQLSSDSEDVENKRPIPNGISVLDYTLEETLLTLYFSEAYSGLDRFSEVLTRAAVVRTMMQVNGVECISFYVEDDPLLDQEGNPVGFIKNDFFIENPGEQINSIQTASLVLYFANKKGNGLVRETKDVHYSSNISMEKLVMENLLQGPEGSDAQYAIPEGTKLMNVSVLEGVCYVSLDENFLTQNYNIEEPVVIYSIVNSLSEIPTINKVQISVNGDTSSVYREKMRLDELYERNLDYVDE